MKIKGKRLGGPNIEVIVIPRANGKSIVFKAQAVLNHDEFIKMCPLPIPPTIKYPDQTIIHDFKDKAYLKKIAEHNQYQTHWTIIESLKATDGLEWETVIPNDPKTWVNYVTELKAENLTVIEINLIVDGVLSANSLDEDKIREARDSFFDMEAQKEMHLSSQMGEQASIPPGEPAKDSESNPQESETTGTTVP